MRLLTLSTSAAAFGELMPALLDLYSQGPHDAVLVIAGPEWELQSMPFPVRWMEEFAPGPEPEPSEGAPKLAEWRLQVARRALLEERPDALLTSASEALWEPLAPWLEQCGIHWLRCRPHAGAPLPDWSRWQREPRLVEVKPQQVSLEVGGLLACAEHPDQKLRDMVAQQRRWSFWEAVNLPLEGGRHRFRYGRYDNEFGLAPASHDLKALLSEQLRPDQFRVRVAPRRAGQAPLPDPVSPDGLFPRFDIEIDLDGLPPAHWLDPYRQGERAELQLLILDPHNVAGAGMQLSYAINRYTSSRAEVVCRQPHPFISPAGPECRVSYSGSPWSSELRPLVERADLLVFIEDDDADTLDWPADIAEVARGKPSLHFYVGFLAQRNIAGRKAKPRQVITGLPHLLRIYPEAHFYTGFLPPRAEATELRPPLSHDDGVVRVLHTPSLPDERMHRLMYHKDSDAYFDAAQFLKARHPKVRFLQLAGVAHHHIMQARLDCDIAFHQLRGFMGMSGNESMLLARATVQSFNQENANRHLEYWGLDAEFPWAEADRSNLPQVLEHLIVDPDWRGEVAERCRRFMLHHYAPSQGIIPLLHYAQQVVQKC